MAVEIVVGYTARHARRARCASRARTRMSSPCVARVIAVSAPPPCTTGTRALRWRRRLLDRAHTVRRWHWRWRWRSVTPHIASFMRVTQTHTHARTRHRRFPFPPRTTGTRALRWRRRSLDRARAVAARAVTAAAATDDTRDDGRGDDPPAPPSGTGACQRRPPRRSTTASPPRVLIFVLSLVLSHDARAGESAAPPSSARPSG